MSDHPVTSNPEKLFKAAAYGAAFGEVGDYMLDTVEAVVERFYVNPELTEREKLAARTAFALGFQHAYTTLTGIDTVAAPVN